MTLEPKDPEIRFDAAIVASLDHRTAAATDLIRQAIAAGYSVPVILREPELAELRKDEGFRDMLRK